MKVSIRLLIASVSLLVLSSYALGADRIVHYDHFTADW